METAFQIVIPEEDGYLNMVVDGVTYMVFVDMV